MRLSTGLIGAGLCALMATGVAVSAQQSGDTKASAPKQKNERLICRYTGETGSLARRKRQCFTRAEWDRIAEGAQAHTSRMRSDLAGQISGN